MKTKLAIASVLFLVAGLLMAQTHAGRTPSVMTQPCQLVSVNPPGFKPFKYVPKVLDFKRLNRCPRVAYVVNEDGGVTSVKILKGPGSRKVDAALAKSIQEWKYKAQPSCTFEMSGQVIIDIGSQ